MTNTLAYYDIKLTAAVKSFIVKAQGRIILKTFFIATDATPKLARVFNTGWLFQPSLMFVGKARSLPERGFTLVSSGLIRKY
jgi:hypothetical protein